MRTDIVAAHFLGLAAVAERAATELSPDVAEVAGMIEQAFRAGGKLLFCGNGGSAADAQHLATEYVVRFRRNRRPLPAIALTTDTSLLTAASNDLGYREVFARQVEALGRPGDVLFLHSTSGDSENMLAAADAAGRMGMVSVGVLAGNGGQLRERVDRALIVQTDSGAHAQELHIAIGHAICELVERAFAEMP